MTVASMMPFEQPWNGDERVTIHEIMMRLTSITEKFSSFDLRPFDWPRRLLQYLLVTPFLQKVSLTIPGRKPRKRNILSER